MNKPQTKRRNPYSHWTALKVEEAAWQIPEHCQFHKKLCNNRVEFRIPYKGRKVAALFLCSKHARCLGVDNAEFKIGR